MNVIFSNESTFYVIKRKNETKIWRTKDERWHEGCMEVAAMGGGFFRLYAENTNIDVYSDILDN